MGSGELDSRVYRLSSFEAAVVQAVRQCTMEKQEAALYLLQIMAKDSALEIPSNVVLLTGRKFR